MRNNRQDKVGKNKQNGINLRAEEMDNKKVKVDHASEV